MLEVTCEEHLAEARAFADTLGPDVRAQLESKLDYLATYRDSTCVCRLYRDFAPYSFEFVLMGPAKPDGSRERWFNGGLIFHAAHSNGVGAPELSVVLNPQDRPHWGVHT